MSEKSLNTNLASEYYILSCLYRIGSNAYLTLGNKKSVDIIIEKKGELLTVDVKGLLGNTNFPIDNWSKKDKNHYLIFVSFDNKIQDTNYCPEVYIVPSAELENTYNVLGGKSIIYSNPKGNRKVVQLNRLRTLEREFKNKYRDNWLPFIDNSNEEAIFEIGGEGGSLSIYKKGNKFLYKHNENDFSVDGYNINTWNEFSTFEAAFQLINEKYPWHLLYLVRVDDNYKEYIYQKLIFKLNEEKISPESFNKSEFEEKLGVFFYSTYEKDEIRWNYK